MLNAARDFGKQVVLFSLQTSREKVLAKLVSMAIEIEFGKLTSGRLTGSEREQVEKFRQVWKEYLASRIRIIDTPGLSIKELLATATQLRNAGAELFFIDNIQRITLSKKMRGYCANREQEVAYITRQLKTLALQTQAPVVAVSELSKAVNDRGGDRKPWLTDLRDSNVLANEADTVLLLYRAELYNITEDEMGNPTNGVAEVKLAKSRFASTEAIQLRFVSRYGRFENTPPFEWGTPELSPNFTPQSSAPLPRKGKNRASSFEEPPF